MGRKNSISLNPFFYLPFLVWVIAGGILRVVYSKEFLFRNINARHSPILDEVMYRITWMGEAPVIIPCLLLIGLTPRYRKWQYFLVAAVVNIVPMLVQQGLKSYFDMPRPLRFFEGVGWIHRPPQWPELFHHSFPSGHSEGAFSFFTLLALLLPSRFRAVGLVFFTLGISVCYSRVYLAAHFFEDVYVGSIIGVFVSTLCFFALKKLATPLFPDNDRG